MRRHLKNTLIPHEGNNHCPTLIRGGGIVALLFILALAFGFSVFQGLVVNRGPEFTASVLPAVLVELTNDDRADEGLGTLTVNPLLEEAARLKAEHMAEHGYFAHKSPDGLDPWYWFYRAGYDFTEAGENLAVNFTDSHDAQRAWMDSPGHRANILNGTFTEIGIAAVPGEYKGKKTVFVVQMFGRPRTVAATVSGPVDVVAVAQPQPSTETLVKEDVSARVEGVSVAEAAPVAQAAVEDEPQSSENVEGASVSFFDSASAQPRATVSWVYIVVSLLVAFVLLCMVFMQVHHKHSRSMLYGVILLVIITLLSYLNALLLSADLIIV